MSRGEKEKLTQPERNVGFRKREQKLPAKNHEALRSLPSVALSSIVGKSLSIILNNDLACRLGLHKNHI